jgi:hypothetical protein
MSTSLAVALVAVLIGAMCVALWFALCVIASAPLRFGWLARRGTSTTLRAPYASSGDPAERDLVALDGACQQRSIPDVP